MKRIALLPLLLSFTFVLLSSGIISAQPVMREKAKNVINRSAAVVYTAHKWTMANKVFTGNLKKAVVHQRFAIKLFNDGKYMKAIHHARRARELARLQIEANAGTFPAGYEPSSDENAEGPAPTNEELDLEVATDSAATAEDKDLSTQPLNDLEIKE